MPLYFTGAFGCLLPTVGAELPGERWAGGADFNSPPKTPLLSPGNAAGVLPDPWAVWGCVGLCLGWQLGLAQPWQDVAGGTGCSHGVWILEVRMSVDGAVY